MFAKAWDLFTEIWVWTVFVLVVLGALYELAKTVFPAVVFFFASIFPYILMVVIALVLLGFAMGIYAKWPGRVQAVIETILVVAGLVGIVMALSQPMAIDFLLPALLDKGLWIVIGAFALFGILVWLYEKSQKKEGDK